VAAYQAALRLRLPDAQRGFIQGRIRALTGGLGCEGGSWPSGSGMR
jgi:hypothetical protein